MPRVKRGYTTHRRHAAILERAKGFRTGRRRLIRRANEALLKAGMYAYRDRRVKKRDLRREWITRINAAVRLHGLTYSSFMAGLRKLNIGINRKMLSDMALNDPHSVEALAKKVSSAPSE
jgi:large subunit ribosomal protein L20